MVHCGEFRKPFISITALYNPDINKSYEKNMFSVLYYTVN